MHVWVSVLPWADDYTLTHTFCIVNGWKYRIWTVWFLALVAPYKQKKKVRKWNILFWELLCVCEIWGLNRTFHSAVFKMMLNSNNCQNMKWTCAIMIITLHCPKCQHLWKFPFTKKPRHKSCICISLTFTWKQFVEMCLKKEKGYLSPGRERVTKDSY